MADDAGALLVRSGLVTSTALDEARARAVELGGTIGEQLVSAGVVEDDQLTEFYRSRLLVPQVNPNSLARLPIKVIAAIPSDMAVELRVVPVSLDADNNLTVAMSDPSDRHAVDEIAFFTGAYVVRACATQMQIAWCLAHYYGHLTPLGHRLVQGTQAEPVRKAAPTPVAAVPERTPRMKGLTGRVEAARRRAVAPVTGPVDIVRPTTGQLDDPPEPTHEPATPEPRAHSVSGEIRLPSRRAESIKPEIVEDEIYGEEDDDAVAAVDADPTAPIRATRRRKPKTDPPELAARAGELDMPTGPVRAIDTEPRIIVDDSLAPAPVQPETSGEVRVREHGVAPAHPHTTVEVDDASVGAVIHDYPRHDSEPVLLERRRAEHHEDDGEVVVLERSKPTPRRHRATSVGIGAVSALTRPHGDPDAGGVPADEIDDGPTTVTAGSKPDERRPSAQRLDYDPVDDSWGPPGTTIPPPLIGAAPGSEDDDSAIVKGIPLAMDSAPLIIAPPSPPEATRGTRASAHTSGTILVRALEEATSRSVALINALELAVDRDSIISLMVDHLAESHRRSGFFAIKANELVVFAMQPRPVSLPLASLRLDRPSTLEDVVGTRLPYRGPMHDAASRAYLDEVLGSCPPEILLVPVTIRERVVGVLFGEHRVVHTFDDQLALA
ncbi:MAG TPA: hypothetical protein VK427_26585, partial [Kofleriaceae bacterium]|nr:hypothetical protein [Kofleriaceae bacterium]